MKSHRADILVIAIAFTMCVATFIAGITFAHKTATNTFCDIVNATLAVPALKPADPVLHPGQQEEYLNHLKFLELSGVYHCGGKTP